MKNGDWVQLKNITEYRWHFQLECNWQMVTFDKMWLKTVGIMWLNTVVKMWLNTVDILWLNWVDKMWMNTFDKIWLNTFYKIYMNTPSWFLFKRIWSFKSDFRNIRKNLPVYNISKPYELIFHLVASSQFYEQLVIKRTTRERFAMSSRRRLS